MSHPGKFVPLQAWNNLSSSVVKCFIPEPYPLICQAIIDQRSLKGSSLFLPAPHPLLSPQVTGVLGGPLPYRPLPYTPPHPWAEFTRLVKPGRQTSTGPCYSRVPALCWCPSNAQTLPDYLPQVWRPQPSPPGFMRADPDISAFFPLLCPG